jgi:hypothetical protein
MPTIEEMQGTRHDTGPILVTVQEQNGEHTNTFYLIVAPCR